jgi:hypothetical protein
MGLETDSLLPSNANGDESSKYYFLNSVNNEYQGGTTQAVRDGDGGEIVEGIPEGATEDEFAPRTLPKILVCVPDSFFNSFAPAIDRNVEFWIFSHELVLSSSVARFFVFRNIRQ